MNRLEWQEDTASEKISKRFRLYKYISLTVLVVFLLGGLVLFEKDITVENLRYLIKYLDFSSSGSFEEETEIHYNADVSNRFDVFRGDLVVAGESGVTLYDRRGTAVLSDRYTMSHPVCVPGDRYLIVYDLGGYQVRLYNSFALLHEKSFDYAIRSVSVNADGNFCVVTAEKSYHSAVFVYDDDFEEIHRWLSTDKFAMDASLSDEGVLSISAVRALEGDLVADLIELKIGREEPLSVFTYTDELPLDFSASKEGTLLLSENSLRLIREGVQIREQRFESGSLEKVFFGEELFVAVQNQLSVGVNFRVRIFDREGAERVSRDFSVQILDIKTAGDTAYFLTYTGLVTIRTDGTVREYPLEGEYSSLGVLFENTVVLCSDASAQIRILNPSEEE